MRNAAHYLAKGLLSLLCSDPTGETYDTEACAKLRIALRAFIAQSNPPEADQELDND